MQYELLFYWFGGLGTGLPEVLAEPGAGWVPWLAGVCGRVVGVVAGAVPGFVGVQVFCVRMCVFSRGNMQAAM